MSPEAVVVTGAAGAIGSAVARAFLALGFDVVGVDRAESQEAAANYLHVLADVSEPGDLDLAVAACRSLGPLAHVVAVAGGAVPGELGCTDPGALPIEVFEQSVRLNLTASFVTIRTFLPLLRAVDGHRPNRSITLTSSVNGLVGMDLPAYSAAKAGLLGLTRVLAKQLGPDGIRVNAVAPGTVPTPRTVRAWAHDPGHFERLTAQAPLGRLSCADEVAAAVTAVATSLTSMTGQTLVVDAGQTATWTY